MSRSFAASISGAGLHAFVPIMTILLLTSASVSSAQNAYDVETQPMIGDAAPSFALQTIAGDSLALGDLKGEYLVVHFGTSW